MNEDNYQPQKCCTPRSCILESFHFYSGKKYFGKTFYAVTPAFVEKCKISYSIKGDGILIFLCLINSTYEMSPLTTEHLYELAMRILETHGIAYNWEPDLEMKASQLLKIINAASLRGYKIVLDMLLNQLLRLG